MVKSMTKIKTNEDQFKILAENRNEGPVVMLNLLKFKKKGGREVYFRYIKESGPFAEEIGAKVLYIGRPNELLYGEEKWDLLLLIHYPSREAFQKMINNPGYLKTHELREEGTERAVLYATDPIEFKDILSE